MFIMILGPLVNIMMRYVVAGYISGTARFALFHSSSNRTLRLSFSVAVVHCCAVITIIHKLKCGNVIKCRRGAVSHEIKHSSFKHLISLSTAKSVQIKIRSL